MSRLIIRMSSLGNYEQLIKDLAESRNGYWPVSKAKMDSDKIDGLYVYCYVLKCYVCSGARESTTWMMAGEKASLRGGCDSFLVSCRRAMVID